MMNDDQRDLFLSTVTDRLVQTAQWRKGVASKWPDDVRNGRAAARLTQLVRSDGREICEATWAALAPAVTRRDILEIINEAGREVGFKSRPENLDALLLTIADKATARAGGAA
jgi:hypothetical protein